MEFHVLGPVEVVVAGKAAGLGGPKPRTLLALLAVNAGHVVSLEQLIDAIWGEEPPEQARAAVYTYISTLRRALADGGDPDVIARSGGGYRLAVDLDQVDLHIFVREMSAGRRAKAAGEPDRAVSHLRQALAVWRGTALGGTQGTWAENERARLDELRVAALEDRVDVELETGAGESLVAELTSAVAEHPLRERLRAQLMLALHQSGRRADALACYQDGRKTLLDELGLEPGPVLLAAHDRVLRDEPGTPAAKPGTDLRVPVPSQLPFDIADFTGRAHEVVELTRWLSADAATGSRLCAVYGKPGAGKSTVAAHVAHRVREQFPDGQLYASLRGVQAVRADPAEVLAGFLRALGVPEADLPARLEERAQLYRTLLADRRILVVLDDASDERQVRPLLPGGHTCAALVTSRERLGALGGAAHLHLPVLDEAEALDLLGRVIGDDRVAEHTEAARELVRLCGNLPLAVRIAGARLAARPQWKVGRLTERLRVQHRILQELTLGDLEVRGSFALSYDGLDDRERTALRRLGLLDVSSFGAWVVAPLLGCDGYEAEEVVERLVDAQLLDVSTVDDHGGALRYQIHDLTRAFARERGEAEETKDEIKASAERAAECWLGLVELAGRAAHAPAEGSPLARYLAPAQIDEILADPEVWFDAEQTGLVGVVERVSGLDLTDVATRLAAALCSSVFAVRNLFGQWWRTHNAALAAARRAGDRTGEARLLSGLGWLRYEQDRFDESIVYHEQALAAYELDGDRRGQAMSRLDLSVVQCEYGQFAQARHSLDLALPDLRELGEKQAEIQALHGLGRVHTEQGELDEALVAAELAVAGYATTGDESSRALALRSVSLVHRAAGRLAEAARCSQEAVDLLRAADDPLMSAYAVQALAKVRIRQGRGDEVREAMVKCLATCHEMQDGFGQGLMLRTLGELELAAGRFLEARAHLERSVQWWDALMLPVWRARALRDLATTLEALGETVGAEAAWTEAVGIFRLHGSREAREPRPVLRLANPAESSPSVPR